MLCDPTTLQLQRNRVARLNTLVFLSVWPADTTPHRKTSGALNTGASRGFCQGWSHPEILTCPEILSWRADWVGLTNPKFGWPCAPSPGPSQFNSLRLKGCKTPSGACLIRSPLRAIPENLSGGSGKGVEWRSLRCPQNRGRKQLSDMSCNIPLLPSFFGCGARAFVSARHLTSLHVSTSVWWRCEWVFTRNCETKTNCANCGNDSYKMLKCSFPSEQKTSRRIRTSVDVTIRAKSCLTLKSRMLEVALASLYADQSWKSSRICHLVQRLVWTLQPPCRMDFDAIKKLFGLRATALCSVSLNKAKVRSNCTLDGCFRYEDSCLALWLR